MGSEKTCSEKASFKNQDIITIDISTENHSDLMNIMKELEELGLPCKDANECIARIIHWWYW